MRIIVYLNNKKRKKHPKNNLTALVLQDLRERLHVLAQQSDEVTVSASPEKICEALVGSNTSNTNLFIEAGALYARFFNSYAKETHISHQKVYFSH
tara:strand:+ start:268 stop:555 length:288 start_codon:yes stop_codon:yes gene_type:complete